MKGNIFGKILFLIRNKPSIIRRFPRKINEHRYTSTVELRRVRLKANTQMYK